MSESKKNTNLALSIVAIIAGMVMLAFASVPIYNVFCKATGTGGVVKIADRNSEIIGNRQIKINFDANIDKDLPWSFKAEQKHISVTTGENAIIFYSAQNLSNQDIVGTAIYNVSPHKAAKYFFKIQCFCFQEQLLRAGQTMNMPVSFYIDPQIENDKNLKDINEITLSYSFYKISE